MEADPKLLSQLEKIQNPHKTLKLEIEVLGVFSYPEHWEEVDELNREFYTQKIEFQGIEISSGKTKIRELTEEEQAEEDDKLKKKAKKGKDEDVELTPEEQAELDKQKLEKDTKMKEEAEIWDSLSEEEQKYRTKENPQKHSSIKFPEQLKVIDLEETGIKTLETDISKFGKGTITFNRYIDVPAEELDAFKKKKPKGTLPQDMKDQLGKGEIDLVAFQTPGVTEITQRIHLKQFFPQLTEEELEEQAAKKKKKGEDEVEDQEANIFEEKQTYVHLRLKITPAINPLVTEILPIIDEIAPLEIQARQLQKPQNSEQLVESFKSSLYRAVNSLALDYTQFIGKDQNQNQDKKQKSLLSPGQKYEIRQANKEKYMKQFFDRKKNYNKLKDMLRMPILNIIKDKFIKQGKFHGITKRNKNLLLSELFVYMKGQMQQTIADVVRENKSVYIEDVHKFYEESETEKNVLKNKLNSETEEEHLKRLANEYEIYNELDTAENMYKNMLKGKEDNTELQFSYATFLLRQKKFLKAEQVLTQSIKLDNQNEEKIFLLACLKLRRGRYQQCLNIMKKLYNSQKYDLRYNTFLAFLYKTFLLENRKSKRYFLIAQKIHRRISGQLQPKQDQLKEAYDVMGIRFGANIAEDKGNIELSNDIKDLIYMKLIDYFEEYNLFELAEKVVQLIIVKSNLLVQRVLAKIAFFHNNIEESQQILEKLIEFDPDNSTLFKLKANICFFSQRYYEAEETFLHYLVKKQAKDFQSFMRLAKLFLLRKAWSDAKSIFKLASQIKDNCSLAWQGLGIACLKLGNFDEAEEALTQANIFDPISSETWCYLCLLSLLDGSKINQASQALKEAFKCEIRKWEVISDVGDEFAKVGEQQQAKQCYQFIIQFGKKNVMQMTQEETVDVTKQEIIEEQPEEIDQNQSIDNLSPISKGKQEELDFDQEQKEETPEVVEEVKEQLTESEIVKFTRNTELEQILAQNLKVDHDINILPSDLGNIHWKLANMYSKEMNDDNAQEQYKNALKLIEGDTNKEKIEEMLRTIESSKGKNKKSYRF